MEVKAQIGAVASKGKKHKKQNDLGTNRLLSFHCYLSI
jgi:hypothetical protein